MAAERVYLAIVIKREAMPGHWLSPHTFARQYEQGPDSWEYENHCGSAAAGPRRTLLDSLAQGRRLRSGIEMGLR
jgi:hypothetical protein